MQPPARKKASDGGGLESVSRREEFYQGGGIVYQGGGSNPGWRQMQESERRIGRGVRHPVAEIQGRNRPASLQDSHTDKAFRLRSLVFFESLAGSR